MRAVRVRSVRTASTFTVLSIGGSDPTGGAGIQGDLKTFEAHGAQGCAVVAALTAQNSDGVQAVEAVSPEFLRAQLESLYAQVEPAAGKTGMLLDPAAVEVVAALLSRHPAPWVVDPVLAASAGGTLARTGLLECLVRDLVPRARLVTPNLAEAAALLGREVAPEEAAEAARALCARWRGPAVLVKGGHGLGPRSTDWLATPEGLWSLSLPRLDTPHGHGTGCALSASVAVRLARGTPLLEAVAQAKAYLHRALTAAGPLGRGRGPVHHAVPADTAGDADPRVDVRSVGPSHPSPRRT